MKLGISWRERNVVSHEIDQGKLLQTSHLKLTGRSCISRPSWNSGLNYVKERPFNLPFYSRYHNIDWSHLFFLLITFKNFGDVDVEQFLYQQSVLNLRMRVIRRSFEILISNWQHNALILMRSLINRNKGLGKRLFWWGTANFKLRGLLILRFFQFPRWSQKIVNKSLVVWLRRTEAWPRRIQKFVYKSLIAWRNNGFFLSWNWLIQICIDKSLVTLVHAHLLLLLLLILLSIFVGDFNVLDLLI